MIAGVSSAATTTAASHFGWLPVVVVAVVALILAAVMVGLAVHYLARTITSSIGGIETVINTRLKAVEGKLDTLSENYPHAPSGLTERNPNGVGNVRG